MLNQHERELRVARMPIQRAGALLMERMRLSSEESERLLVLIRQWMRRLGIRSGYELYLLGSVSRATIYRWLGGRIPVDGARQLAEILSQYANHDGPTRDIEAVLEDRSGDVPALSPLIAEFRARRVPYRRAIEAITAARFRIVPIESSTNDIFGKGPNDSE